MADDDFDHLWMCPQCGDDVARPVETGPDSITVFCPQCQNLSEVSTGFDDSDDLPF